MKRRVFIKKATKAVVFAATTGGVGFLFHNRETPSYHDVLIGTTDFSVPNDPAQPQVTLAKNPDHARALRAALDGIGSIGRFIKPGEKVTIKPNVGWDRTAEQAANTNPVLVGEMVRLCLEAGASSVLVSDVTCNDPRRCFLRSGIREQAELAGAQVILESDADFVTADLGGQLLTQWPVLKHFVQCDRLINMPIVKHHSLSKCTIGMKNLYGILGGRRNQLHQQIDQSIVDLAAFSRPTLTIVDATRVLMRGGPQGGSLDDVEKHDTVICATDQVAADSLASTYLGHEIGGVSHIVLAEKAGLGLIDYRESGFSEIT